MRIALPTFGNKLMLFFPFLEELRRIGIQSSLSACCKSVVMLSGPGILTFGEIPLFLSVSSGLVCLIAFSSSF